MKSIANKILHHRDVPSRFLSCLFVLLCFIGGSKATAQSIAQPLRVLYVNTKDFESKEAGRRLDFASFSGRAAALGALNFNSIIFYQFHHFRENPDLHAQILEAAGFAAKLIRERGEIPYVGTHVSPGLFATDSRYREDVARFFSELKQQGAEPIAATGNTSWVADAGQLVERPVFLEQLKAVAAWCTERKIPLYIISDMSTTYDAAARKSQYPDTGDDGAILPRVLDVANSEPARLYRQFFENIANLRRKYPAIAGAGLEEFPQQGRFLQDDKPVLPGFSDAWKQRFAQVFPGSELPRYNSLGGPGNAVRLQFLDQISSEFFAGIVPSDPGFQVTHLNNYIANWRYKMSVPRGNLSGDPYVYDTWMLPSPVTFLQPSLIEQDPSLAERFHLLLLHPRGRALNQWHLEKRSPQFGTDRVAASWPLFMAGAAPPLVGYQDQLLGVLPHFSGILILPYRITSDNEDEVLAKWVKDGNILVLGSFAGEDENGQLDPAHPHLPAKWSSGQDHLLQAAGWMLPQSPEESLIKDGVTAKWTNAFPNHSLDAAEFSLTGMAGRSLAIPKAPKGAVTFVSINGTPYVQGIALGKGWMIWHNILPFTDSSGRLAARYDSQEGWLPLRELPTRLLCAGLNTLNLPAHVSDTSLVFGNGKQTVEVETAPKPSAGSPGYQLSPDEIKALPKIQWLGDDTPLRQLWAREFARYWPAKLPADHFLTRIDAVQIETNHQEHDGFSCAVIGRTIHLKAANPRCALIGLYRLLEKLGWRWAAPGKDRFSNQWLVDDPSKLTLSVTPALELRGMMTHTPLTEDTLRWIAWLPKAGYNLFLVPGPYWDKAPASVKTALAERQLIVEVGAHSFDYWYPHQKYFPIAPETFALVNGSRELPPNRWIDDLLADRQVATTNPSVPPVFAQALDKFARDNPAVTRLSLWPNDGFGWDESPEARALDRDGMCLLHPGKPNYGRRYLGFVQAVQSLRQTNTPATMIAYAATLQFPQGAGLTKGLPVYVAPYLENYAAPLAGDKLEANACYWREAKNWIAAGAKVTLFEYWLKYAWLSQPLPIIAQQQANIQAFSAAGGAGVLTQAELNGWDVNAPLYYAGGRLLMEPEANAQALIKEYFEADAGTEAGPLLARFWEDLENQLATIGELTAFGANLPKVFTPEILQKWDKLVKDLKHVDSPRAQEVAQIWSFRRDVAKQILEMRAQSERLATQAEHDSQGVLQGYEQLVLAYDELLEGLRASPYRRDFDPLLPKFLASNILRPVVKKMQKGGVVIPGKFIRGPEPGVL